MMGHFFTELSIDSLDTKIYEISFFHKINNYAFGSNLREGLYKGLNQQLRATVLSELIIILLVVY